MRSWMVPSMPTKAALTVEVRLIRRVHVSPASEGDQTHLLKVLDQANTSRDVYADRGYTELDELKQAGWRQHVQRRAKPKRELSETQFNRNRRIAKIRARGEHPFAGHGRDEGSLRRSGITI